MANPMSLRAINAQIDPLSLSLHTWMWEKVMVPHDSEMCVCALHVEVQDGYISSQMGTVTTHMCIPTKFE